jgi:hypothetical protein
MGETQILPTLNVNTPMYTPIGNMNTMESNTEIGGITNAPMYSPIENINNPAVDIFLNTQINTNQKNVSFLEQPPALFNHKINTIQSNTKLEVNVQNLDAVTGHEVHEYSPF